MAFRIGQGIDIHQLSSGYELIIGGIAIPFDKGSKGHSDGDVLFHSIVDALLGAMSMGDIGQYFPSSDKKWKGASSHLFLLHALTLLNEKGFKIENIDATIILQEPHINRYIPQIKKNLSKILNLSENFISVKATTSDHLGFCGRGEGIYASAIVLIYEELSK